MRILILGASGGCGRWATKLVHGAGHTVTALARPETGFDPPAGVTVQRGSVLDASDLARAGIRRLVAISAAGVGDIERTPTIARW